MILVIDTGNSLIKLGCVDEDNNIKITVRIPTDKRETEHGYASKLKYLLEANNIDISSVKGAIISSVVPPVTTALKLAIKLLFGVDAMVLGYDGVTTGLKIGLYGAIAPDLEAAAFSASVDYPLPCYIANLGTATTVTVVDETGTYIGGVICPGVATSLSALVNKTSLLPSVAIEPPTRAVATDTSDAIKSGLVYGSAGAIDGIIDHFIEELGCEPAKIIATGGLGPIIAPICRHEIVVDDELILRGLIKTYYNNL